jgi:hypothetical protein
MIYGLEDQMAVLGHVKIGGVRTVETRHGLTKVPEKHDYFTVTTAQRNKHGYGYEVDTDLMDILIKKDKTSKDGRLRRMMVMLPSNDMDENLVTNLAIYDTKGCRCRGDGKEAEFINPINGKVHKVPCPCQMLRIRLGQKDNPDSRPTHKMNIQPNAGRGYICKANGILRLLILEAKTVGGIHLLKTTSSNSIKQLFASMRHISFITGGVIAHVPLMLEVNPKRVRPAYSDKYQTVYVVNLTHKESNLGEFLRKVAREHQLYQQMRKSIAGKKEYNFLPAPGFENIDEQQEVAGEYWPEDEENNNQDQNNQEVINNNQEPEQKKQKPTDSRKPQTPLDQAVPLVLTTPPKNSDERPASTSLRKKLIELGREATLTDKTIRGWLKNLWDTESTGNLKVWQIAAMIEALEKHIANCQK